MKALRDSPSLHYNLYAYKSRESMEMLKEIFPDGQADAMNFCLFSTSGIHGSYFLIEEAEAELRDKGESEITFLVIHPRVVAMRYGQVFVSSQEDIDFLKKLRDSSIEVVKKIGYP